MIKHAFIASCLFLIVQSVLAQKNKFSLQFGMQVPVGSYATTGADCFPQSEPSYARYNHNYYAKGYAEPGFSMDFTYQHEFSNKYGFIFKYRRFSNALNTTQIETDMNVTGVSSTKWSVGTHLFGINKKYEPVDGLGIVPRICLGFTSELAPMVTSSGTALTIYGYDPRTLYCLAYSFGLSIDADLTKHIFIALDTDYLGTGIVTAPTSEIDYDTPDASCVEIINIGFSIGYQF